MNGTKNGIIAALENENKELAVELLSAMDEEWINAVKESGNFRLFKDSRPVYLEEIDKFKPYFKTSYMDDSGTKKFHIPVLKYIHSRQLTFQRNWWKIKYIKQSCLN